VVCKSVAPLGWLVLDPLNEVGKSVCIKLMISVAFPGGTSIHWQGEQGNPVIEGAPVVARLSGAGILNQQGGRQGCGQPAGESNDFVRLRTRRGSPAGRFVSEQIGRGDISRKGRNVVLRNCRQREVGAGRHPHKFAAAQDVMQAPPRASRIGIRHAK